MIRKLSYCDVVRYLISFPQKCETLVFLNFDKDDAGNAIVILKGLYVMVGA